MPVPRMNASVNAIDSANDNDNTNHSHYEWVPSTIWGRGKFGWGQNQYHPHCPIAAILKGRTQYRYDCIHIENS